MNKTIGVFKPNKNRSFQQMISFFYAIGYNSIVCEINHKNIKSQ